jgi:hypothetical protein
MTKERFMNEKQMKTALIATFLVFASITYAGTASVTINMPYDDAYYLICDAIRYSKGLGCYTPYIAEDGSMDVKMDDWTYWSAPDSEVVKEQGGADYRDYILPAYIYSLEAEARQWEWINVREDGNKTQVVVDIYWEMDILDEWVEVESNNKLAEKFANFLVSYCNNPSQYE